MAICDIQKQNRMLRGDFLHMIENYLARLKGDIEKPDKMNFFECELSNNRKLKFHFIEESTKQKCYELEFNTEDDTDRDTRCICLSDSYSDFDDALFKIRRDVSQLFFDYPI